MIIFFVRKIIKILEKINNIVQVYCKECVAKKCFKTEDQAQSHYQSEGSLKLIILE